MTLHRNLRWCCHQALWLKHQSQHQSEASGWIELQGTPEGVEDNGSLTRVAAFPIGIDPERFQRALERVDVRSHIAELLNRYAGRKVGSCCLVTHLLLVGSMECFRIPYTR